VHKTYDSAKATNPADAALGPAPDDNENDLPPEPTVEETWDGGRREYVHEVTFASGKKFYVIGPARSGPFDGEYWITGPDFYSDGFTSPEKAIDYLLDIERRVW
jgi:hypothetical protein